MLYRIFVYSLLHFVGLFVCLLLALDFGSVDGEEPSKYAKVADVFVEVMMKPGEWVWTRWASHHLADFYEWALVGVNSILWGVALNLVHVRIRRSFD